MNKCGMYDKLLRVINIFFLLSYYDNYCKGYFFNIFVICLFFFLYIIILLMDDYFFYFLVYFFNYIIEGKWVYMFSVLDLLNRSLGYY